MIETLLFWICGGLTIAGAVGAATVRNLFHAALLLGLCLAGVAGLYLFLEAHYLACIQVVVYLGGILVLVLFATLYSADLLGAVQRTPAWVRLAGATGTALAALVAMRLAEVAISVSLDLDRQRSPPGTAPDPIDGGRAIGDLLIGDWLVAFLAAGVLLTAALVGAVSVVRRHRGPPRVPEAGHG